MSEKKEILSSAIANGSKLFDELVSFFSFEFNNDKDKYSIIDPLYPPLVYQNLLKIVMHKIDWILIKHPEKDDFVSDIPIGYAWTHYYNTGESLELFPKGAKYCSDLPYTRAYFQYGNDEEENNIRERFKDFDFVKHFENCASDIANFEIQLGGAEDSDIEDLFEEFYQWKKEKILQILDIGREIYGYAWYR
jgi:hypothetical protein